MLTVLSVAYPLAPVGPSSVGGAEQVLAQLDRALMVAGHNSIVIGREGSSVQGNLIAIPGTTGELTESVRRRVQHETHLAIEAALNQFRIDIVHLHGCDFYHYLPQAGVAVLATLHLPVSWYPPEIFQLKRSNTTLNCVSSAQTRSCPPSSLPVECVENGVDIQALSLRLSRRRFALCLGRICPEKGYHLALGAAAQAGVPLLIAGEVFPYQAHENYFREHIVPRLDNSRRFIGPVAFERKRRLLSSATCVLIPSLAPETSSLVAMEALACGTPVIAFPSGALADIVEHGRTGFLVSDAGKMAEAINSVAALDREACRAAAKSRFSLEKMVDAYLSLYETIVSGRSQQEGTQ